MKIQVTQKRYLLFLLIKQFHFFHSYLDSQPFCFFTFIFLTFNFVIYCFHSLTHNIIFLLMNCVDMRIQVTQKRYLLFLLIKQFHFFHSYLDSQPFCFFTFIFLTFNFVIYCFHSLTHNIIFLLMNCVDMRIQVTQKRYIYLLFLLLKYFHFFHSYFDSQPFSFFTFLFLSFNFVSYCFLSLTHNM